MRRILAVLSALLVLCACGKTGQIRNPSSLSIRVLAAASLSEAFTELARTFEAQHPGIKVEESFAGSATLDAQIAQGVPADVFASADVSSMSKVSAFTAAPSDFARNTMTIAVGKQNPKHVTGLPSLARKDLVVVLCNVSVPCGKLARKIIDGAHLKVSPSSLEENVKGVVTKVRTGEADAGIVYVTDVLASGGALGAIQIPAAGNAVTTYQIARLKTTANPTLADAFIGFVRSSSGQAILRDRGFLQAA